MASSVVNNSRILTNPNRIAIGGSAADPTHLGHLAVLLAIMSLGFDKVIWILSGSRHDKHLQVCPNHRIAMNELTIRDLRLRTEPDLVVIYDDIYGENKPTKVWLDLLQVTYPQAELHWFTGSDSVKPREELGGLCEIQAKWVAGRKLYRENQFVIFQRAGYLFDFSLLPSNFYVHPHIFSEISSSQIRKLIRSGGEISTLVDSAVVGYINRHNLYRNKEEEQ